MSKRPSTKVFLIASLGLLIPMFIVGMAFLASNSDAKNQVIYKQQQAEILERVKQREAQQAASEATP